MGETSGRKGKEWWRGGVQWGRPWGGGGKGKRALSTGGGHREGPLGTKVAMGETPRSSGRLWEKPWGLRGRRERPPEMGFVMGDPKDEGGNGGRPLGVWGRQWVPYGDRGGNGSGPWRWGGDGREERGGGVAGDGGTPGMVGGTPRNGGRLHEKPWGLKGQWERMGVGSGRGAWG